jgi:3-methyladenine DNA glycosylase AlkD
MSTLTKTALSSWRECIWQPDDYRALMTLINSQRDAKYQIFNEKIIAGTRPTLGVRMSFLRPLSGQIARGKNVLAYLRLPKGESHEEVLLEGLVISQAKLTGAELNRWIAYYVDKIDSWALCDSFVGSQLLAGQEEAFWPEVQKYLTAANPWCKRFAYITMMSYYLDEAHLEKVLTSVLKNSSDHYYVQMAQAWLLATAWTKHRLAVKKFLTTYREQLPLKLKKMTGQKLRDSRLVSPDDKSWTYQW